MYKINIKRIRGLMAEGGHSVVSLSSDIGINRNTLSHYFDCPAKMPYGVIARIAEILCETPEQAMRVFFAQELA